MERHAEIVSHMQCFGETLGTDNFVLATTFRQASSICPTTSPPAYGKPLSQTGSPASTGKPASIKTRASSPRKPFPRCRLASNGSAKKPQCAVDVSGAFSQAHARFSSCRELLVFSLLAYDLE